jgi:hypothetical protein
VPDRGTLHSRGRCGGLVEARGRRQGARRAGPAIAFLMESRTTSMRNEKAATAGAIRHGRRTYGPNVWMPSIST